MSDNVNNHIENNVSKEQYNKLNKDLNSLKNSTDEKIKTLNNSIKSLMGDKNNLQQDLVKSKSK
jgi:hypothetical protein